jgi:hypothetical protein
MGQMKMKCIFDIEKYFYVDQGYSGERCGSWASCLKLLSPLGGGGNHFI